MKLTSGIINLNQRKTDKMDIEEINLKWRTLQSKNSDKVNSLRIDGICIPQLFLGVNKLTQRCLMLKLPEAYSTQIQSSIKQNLSLELFSETNWLVLTLLDDEFVDVFNELIISVYNRVFKLMEPKACITEFVSIYYKWSDFFTKAQNYTLSEEEIKGLFGELIILKELILESGPEEIDSILNSWKGPYDTGHDFVGDAGNIEVKTKNENIEHVKVSSEYQLQKENGKNLDFFVVTVRPKAVDGISLSDLILVIKSLVIVNMGDYAIILNALFKKGLTPANFYEYDSIKLKPINIIKYDVMNIEFPTLNRDNLNLAINTVSYKLNLLAIARFKKNETIL